MDLIEEFHALSDELIRRNIPFALCGGLAMAVHGAPRATIDIDLLIQSEDLPRVKEAAQACGFIIDCGLMPMRGGKSPIYRLTKLDQVDSSVLVLDLLIVTDDIKPSWNNMELRPWQYGSIPVVSLDGLILLKQLRNSTQDKADIERILKIQAGDPDVC